MEENLTQKRFDTTGVDASNFAKKSDFDKSETDTLEIAMLEF